MKYVLFVFWVLAGLVGINREAQAECTLQSGTTLTSVLALPDPLTLPRDQPADTILWDSEWVQGPGTNQVLCRIDFYRRFAWGMPLQPVAGRPNVYALPNIPGVGIKAGWFYGSTGTPPTSIDGAWAFIGEPDSWSIGYTMPFIFRSFLRVQLIAIGPIRTGTQVFPSPAIQVWYGDVNVAQLSLTQTTIEIHSLACTTPDVDVPMGTYSRGALRGIGTSVGSRNFDIHVENCPVGLHAISYSLKSMNGMADTAAGVINLSTASGASGVGIQVTDRNNNPVAFETKIPTVGYNRAAGGNFDIPLRAAYYQTESTVSTGTADAYVELTMSYE